MTPVELINRLVLDQRWQDIIDLILEKKYLREPPRDYGDDVNDQLGKVSHQLHFIMKYDAYGKREVLHNGRVYVSTYYNAVTDWLKNGAPGISQDQVDLFVSQNRM